MGDGRVSDLPESADTPDARLHDAVMSAAARDATAHETGKRRDNLRAILAIFRVGWRLRRAEKTREGKHHDR
jgi:hypothetical protein